MQRIRNNRRASALDLDIGEDFVFAVDRPVCRIDTLKRRHLGAK
jgi:hypothetical protein